MRRRDFISLAGTAIAWPFAAQAQQTKRLPIVGVLGANSTAWKPRTDAFAKRLNELGWVDGRTIAIEYRWDEGHGERRTEIAAEFVRLKADVVVTVGSSVAPLKHATSTIPIVFALANDPIGGGLAASLSRPGG